MRRFLTLLMVLLAFTVLAAPVTANNGNGRGNDNGDDSGTVWNKKKCEDAGGVWVNDEGQKTCYKLDATEERPGEGTVPDEPINDFWRAVDENIGPEVDIVWFYRGETQRGNVGAPGTRDTHNFIDPGDVCAALGPQEFWPPQVCALLYRMLFPDD